MRVGNRTVVGCSPEWMLWPDMEITVSVGCFVVRTPLTRRLLVASAGALTGGVHHIMLTSARRSRIEQTEC
jgi:hypothetical protein